MGHLAPLPIPQKGQIVAPWVVYRIPGCRDSRGWLQMDVPLGSIAHKAAACATPSGCLPPVYESWSSVLHYSAPLDLVTLGVGLARSVVNIPSAVETLGSICC